MTEPNPRYISLAASRNGKVQKECWAEALKLAKLATTDVQIFLDAVNHFPDSTTRAEGNKRFPGLSGNESRAWNAVRGRYWVFRIRRSAAGEFNGFNKKWTEDAWPWKTYVTSSITNCMTR